MIRLVDAVLLDQHDDDWAIGEPRYLPQQSVAGIDHDPKEITTRTNTALPAVG